MSEEQYTSREPQICQGCGRPLCEVEVCCTDATYTDGTHDGAMCRSCCHPTAKVIVPGARGGKAARRERSKMTVLNLDAAILLIEQALESNEDRLAFWRKKIAHGASAYSIYVSLCHRDAAIASRTNDRLVVWRKLVSDCRDDLNNEAKWEQLLTALLLERRRTVGLILTEVSDGRGAAISTVADANVVRVLDKLLETLQEGVPKC